MPSGAVPDECNYSSIDIGSEAIGIGMLGTAPDDFLDRSSYSLLDMSLGCACSYDYYDAGCSTTCAW